MVAKPTSLFLILLVSRLLPASAYNTDVCCSLAKIGQDFVGDVPPLENQTCGQSYSASLPAALPLHVDYAFCSSKCGGMGRSTFDKPSEWAAPVVQFLLPSVIFSMGIPREKVIDVDYTEYFESKFQILNSFLRLIIFLVGIIFVLLPVFVDSVLWIITVVVSAGNMIIGGLYEAVIDYRIVKYVKYLDNSNLPMKRELLATLASGNLRLSPEAPYDPKTKILASLNEPHVDAEKSRSRLLNLIGAQSSFGGAVGSPVLFYLGAFVYTILDLHNDPSDQDNAISLGFGIEWMIIVHVAIVSGTLLAANNPSTSSGIVGSDHEAMEQSRNGSPPRRSFAQKWLGWNKTYETEFQPVSIWSRGANKMEWIKQTQAYNNESTTAAFRDLMFISGWNWFWIFFLAFLLIVIPPAAGGVVAYFTPPRGIACRSLSFIMYGSTQLAVTALATLKAARPEWKSMQGWRFILLSTPFWFCSLLAAIGGTVMQISGVYRNCICYAGADNWVNIAKKNPMVQVANDTQDARTASRYWIWMGIFATLFMAANCYVGWWYQIFIRRRFTEAVQNMYVPLDETGSGMQWPLGNSGVFGVTPVVDGATGRHLSFGLPHIPESGIEMHLVAARESGEDERLIVPGGGRERDGSPGYDVGDRPSDDYERRGFTGL